MSPGPRARRAAVLLLLAAFAVGEGAEAGDAVTLRVDRATRFQTWEAWSCMPNPPGYEKPFAAWVKSPTRETYDRVPVSADLPWKLIDRMHDALVSDIGITRVRLEVGPQVEPVNDNADPATTDESAYRFAWQDDQVERHILPLKRKIEATGERLVIYVSYDLRSRLTPPFLLQPDEYAEMAVTFLRHLRKRYALEPDYWSVLNEPGNDRPGDPALCARLTAATGRRIAAAGFRTRMSGPECVTVAQGAAYMDAMAATPGALDEFRQITYHLYHGGAEDVPARNAVRDRARRLGLTVAQTEWMEGRDMDVARHIHLCLTEADASVWDRFGADLFFALPYDAWLDPASDSRTLSLSSTAWHIRQFSRYIRPGAVRIGLTGGTDAVRGVAFLPPARPAAAAPGGAPVLPVLVLLNVSREARSVAVDGLPPGTYGGSFTSGPGKARGRALDDVVVGEAGRLAFELPPASVTTLAAPGR